MNKYLQTTAVFIGIWFIAAFLNGLLSSIAIIVLEQTYTKMGESTLAMAIIFSFVFSIPVVGFVWFISLIALANGETGNHYFQFVLAASFCCAIAAGIIFILTMDTEFMHARFAVALCIVVSALAAVFLFRKQIKNNE